MTDWPRLFTFKGENAGLVDGQEIIKSEKKSGETSRERHCDRCGERACILGLGCVVACVPIVCPPPPFPWGLPTCTVHRPVREN
jgi:hypothetical protein